MKRLAAVIAVALVLAALLVVALMPTVAGAAPAPPNNPNVLEVTLKNSTDVAVWVNSIGSDLSGGGSPAHVVSGIDAQVFKVVSVNGTYYTHFPALGPFEVVEVTVDLTGDTLEGVFIP